MSTKHERGSYTAGVPADVAQLVERNLAKVEVAGSSPVVRSEAIVPLAFHGGVAERRGSGLQSRVHGFKSRLHLGRAPQQSHPRAIGAVVARFLDTEEVTGSNPVSPTTGERPLNCGNAVRGPSSCRRRGPDVDHGEGETVHGWAPFRCRPCLSDAPLTSARCDGMSDSACAARQRGEGAPTAPRWVPSLSAVATPCSRVVDKGLHGGWSGAAARRRDGSHAEEHRSGCWGDPGCHGSPTSLTSKDTQH